MTDNLNFPVPPVHVDFGFEPRPYGEKEIEALIRSSSHLVMPALCSRVGSMLFFRELQCVYFPPVGPQNNSYHLLLKTWPNFSLDGESPAPIWFIGIIPMRFKRLAEHVAQKNGLRLSNGFPHVWQIGRGNMMGSCRSQRGAHFAKEAERTLRFPYQGDNVFTIEYDDHSAMYDNKAKTADELRQIEQMQIDAVETAYHERFAGWFEARKWRQNNDN